MNRFLSFLFCLLAVATCKTHQTAESITPGDEEFMREEAQTAFRIWTEKDDKTEY